MFFKFFFQVMKCTLESTASFLHTNNKIKGRNNEDLNKYDVTKQHHQFSTYNRKQQLRQTHKTIGNDFNRVTSSTNLNNEENLAGVKGCLITLITQKTATEECED